MYAILYLSDTGEEREHNDTVHQSFIDFKKAYNPVRRKVLYSLHIEFWVPMELSRLLKECLNLILSGLTYT
jgi:hypothetical protein